MNTYAKTCTHQQTVAQRKVAVKILSSLPAKNYKFYMGRDNRSPKTHIVNMVKKGFLDGWNYRIGSDRVDMRPAAQANNMIDAQNWIPI